MLVLTRKEGESIRIGDDVVVTVVQIDRVKIRLGITAPKEVLILRTELETANKGVGHAEAEAKSEQQPQEELKNPRPGVEGSGG